jgi:hypothetical protein
VGLSSSIPQRGPLVGGAAAELLRESGTRLDRDLAGIDRFARVVVDNHRSNDLACQAVPQHGGRSLFGQPLITPSHGSEDDGDRVATLVGEPVLVAGGSLLVRRTHLDAFVCVVSESGGEYIAAVSRRRWKSSKRRTP